MLGVTNTALFVIMVGLPAKRLVLEVLLFLKGLLAAQLLVCHFLKPRDHFDEDDLRRKNPIGT